MRPFLAIVVAVIILGGLHLYMRTRVYDVPPIQIHEHFAPGIYSLDVTLTFRADRDPFAYDLENEPTVLVSFRGQDLLRMTEPVEAFTPLTVDGIDDVVVGEDAQSGANEFFFRMTHDGQQQMDRGVRFRIYRDGELVADETDWSEPGQEVSGTIALVVAKSPITSAHEHRTSQP